MYLYTTAMKKIYIFFISSIFCYQLVFADVQVGQIAPNIEGKLIDGQSYSLNAYRGKVVLINFWASWCEPCKEEMPQIEEYLLKNRSKGFEVIAINLDKSSSIESAKKIMKNYSFRFALKNDSHFSEFGYIWRVPSTFIVDQRGIVRKNGLTGDPKVNIQLLEETVSPLLSSQ